MMMVLLGLVWLNFPKREVDAYLKLKGQPCLDLNKYELIDIEKTDKQRFVAIENGLLEKGRS